MFWRADRGSRRSVPKDIRICFARHCRPARDATRPRDPVYLLLGLLLWAGPEIQAQEIPPATDACFRGLAETTPSAEFTALEDGAMVRHERTGLEWQRCAFGQRWEAESRTCAGRPAVHTWKEAVKRAEQVGDGWRLPTGDELMTIVERCHDGPAINPQVFPNTPGVLFWSSSIDTGGVGRVWAVSFFTGQPFRVGTAQNGRIRLVRGTMQAP